MDYIEVTLNKKVLKELGYEVKYKNYLFAFLFYLFGEDIELVYLKKDGKDVNKLDIPATYTYEGKNYKITKIGNSAFRRCSSLTSVTIPNTVTEIGHRVFQDCSSLTSVTIPNSVTKIGSWVFWECTSLTSVTLSNRITEIDYCLFYNCSSLTNIIIPNSVTTIGHSAFHGCTSLKNLIIPDSVKTFEFGIDGYDNFTGVSHIEYHGTEFLGAPWGAKSMN